MRAGVFGEMISDFMDAGSVLAVSHLAQVKS